MLTDIELRDVTLAQISAYENALLNKVPFTPNQRQRIQELFVQERQAVIDVCNGVIERAGDILCQISQERVAISREARKSNS